MKPINLVKMKIRIQLGLMSVMLAAASARGTLYTESFSPNKAIPDGNPVGITFSGTVNNIPSADIVAGLTVTLNVSGGFNGNLYSYLVAPNGAQVVLLNQPGVTGSNPFGYQGSGFNVTLDDSATSGIQNTPETPGVQFTGTYQAAGTLANVNWSSADGTWELYFADLVNGGGTSTLNTWTLNIDAEVPEPIDVALGIFAGLAILWWCLGLCWNRTDVKDEAPGEPEN
jgi:subtilisin-like proprotein convertase family protein